MKTLTGIIVAAVIIGTPAFAQNSGTGYSITGGTGAAHARAHSRAVTRQVEDPIYAMSPRRNFYGGYPYNDNTGGGSPGYNEMLLRW